jgi:23S rRNA (guanosine2251-2'-O)-methyltransferase
MENLDQEVIGGRKPVLEYLERGGPTEKIFIAQNIRGAFEKSIRELSKARSIPLKVVPQRFFKPWNTINHQGILLTKALTTYFKLDDVLPGLIEQSKPPLVLLLEGVTDVRNLGAIARSAEVFGVDLMILPMKNSAPVNVDSYKTSAGAIGLLTLARTRSASQAIQELKNYGFIIYGTHLSATKHPDQINGQDPIALVMGSEEKGLTRETTELLDEKIKIPQVGKTDSLNVSVACGICLYEILKKRNFTNSIQGTL